LATPTIRPGNSPALQPVRGTAYLAGIVALAHGVNDAYTAFLAPLLPRIMDKMGLSIALAATLGMALNLGASVLQPLMGYLADRYGRRIFVVLGPLFSAVFLSLLGIPNSFRLLVVFLFLGGLGSALFHPPGASLAVGDTAGKGSGLRMSVFSLGGSLGWATGPLIAVGMVGWIGMEGLWVAMFPGILLAGVLLWVLPPGRKGPPAQMPPSPLEMLKRLRGPLGLLFGISVVGAFAQRVFITMEPIVVSRAGGSEAAGAITLSIYLGTQAIGTLVGGFLADRVDRSYLLAGLCFFSFPAHLLAVALPPGEAPALVMAGLSGLFGMAMMPALVVKAQELVPEGAALSSGIVMGLAWAVGSLAVLGTGVLGDWIGPREAAMVSMPALLLGTLLALQPRLRETGRRGGG
jgi:FSR family fosmidomycin resistance protein-like MFS transporter